jgi:hypothetical protein
MSDDDNRHGLAACVQRTDLRPYMRDADTCVCLVSISEHPKQDGFLWLVLGQVSLRPTGSGHDLKGYLGRGATDFEEDSAYAISLPLIGVSMTSLDYHTTEIQAWIDPSRGRSLGPNFHVPRAGYNFWEEGVDRICKEGHPIMKRFTPEFDVDLWNAVRARRVTILVGPASQIEVPK